MDVIFFTARTQCSLRRFLSDLMRICFAHALGRCRGPVEHEYEGGEAANVAGEALLQLPELGHLAQRPEHRVLVLGEQDSPTWLEKNKLLMLTGKRVIGCKWYTTNINYSKTDNLIRKITK